ncbi:MmyB family transcriptional regulator [Streptomyces resistomycificus]|uniref:MmyB family transcriptional regulator n=1 Tax=Streptomyces resistomycificus TaxID=67356 RepID=UPI0035BBB935
MSGHGQETFHHPQVGVLTLVGQSVHLEGTPGQRLGAYTAESGTPIMTPCSCST